MRKVKTSEREEVYSLSVMFYGTYGGSYMHISTIINTYRAYSISLTNLVVYFTVYVIGLKAGTCSYCLYVLLGVVGLPVFSGYVGGPAKIAGPTGGYIVGFVLMALIGGYVIEKTNRNMVLVIIAWIVGTMVDYALGTAWFAYVQHCTVGYT